MSSLTNLASVIEDCSNITCAQFAALSDLEQRLFIVGVANGRGMAAGLFGAYAGGAQDWAKDPAERQAIALGYKTIQGMMEPILGIDARSLLTGIKAKCARPEFQDKLIMDAIASVHLDVAKALKKDWESRRSERRD